MKLSSIIAKEIRLKHLNSGILHTKTRNKYRNNKLKEHYQTPAASRGQLVMYSNAHGNQFVFRKDHFDAAGFPDPAQTYFLIADLQRLINAAVYALWEEGKAYATCEYFPLNRRLLVWSITGLWTLALLLCAAVKFVSAMAEAEEAVEWTIVAGIAAVVLANACVFLRTMGREYGRFEYDDEVVRGVAREIMRAEEGLRECGVEVRCDRQITWICFRTIQASQSSQKEHDDRDESEAG